MPKPNANKSVVVITVINIKGTKTINVENSKTFRRSFIQPNPLYIPSKINGFNNKEEIIPYLKEVMVALEIVDDRNSGSNVTYEKLIAQNSMNHGCIIGESVEIDLMTLDKLEGELIVSDKVFGRGKGKNVLHHPLNSVLLIQMVQLHKNKHINNQVKLQD